MNKFFSFFGEERISGLDIGDDYITAALFSSPENGKIEVENLGWVKNEQDASPPRTVSLIKELWRKEKFNTRSVSFSFRSPALVTRFFKYPDLSEEELESALRLEAEHIFQRPQEDLSIDWYLYPEGAEGAKRIKQGVLIALPKKEVDKHLSIVEEAGLYPVILDVSCMAFSSLFLQLRPLRKDKVVCLANLSSHTADFSILTGDSYIYPRNIYSKNVSWGDRMGDLIEHIIDFLKYHQFKLHGEPVEKLVFIGGLALNEEFKEGIKNSIGLSIEFWDPLKEVSFKKNIDMDKVNSCGSIMATSLGLGMRKGA